MGWRNILSVSTELLKALKVLPADSRRRILAAAAFHGYNQADLANGTGIDETQLSRALNGRRGLTDSQREAVAKFLMVPESVLFPAEAA